MLGFFVFVNYCIKFALEINKIIMSAFKYEFGKVDHKKSRSINGEEIKTMLFSIEFTIGFVCGAFVAAFIALFYI